VTEKDGKVLRFENDQLIALPFIVIEVDDKHERGLMGIALHPEYEENGHFYLYYTVPGENHNRVSMFTAINGFASKNTEEVILELDILSGQMHNGGAMQFGPDGFLYITTGDGVKDNNAQDMNSLLGKILRIRDDGSIPEDNPFFGDLEGKYRSIFALGLRNPFSFDIEKNTGRTMINDVGGTKSEEINILEKGKNYGWPIVEGLASSQITPINYLDPVFQYSHDEGCAIVGAAFSPEENEFLPHPYAKKFFFGDYCNETIKYIDPENPEVATVFAEGVFRPISMMFDQNGMMYLLERSGQQGGSELANRFSKEGVLWKILYNESGVPVISQNPRDLILTTSEDAYFIVSALGDSPLHYQWYRNDMMLSDQTDSKIIVSDVSLSDDGMSFYCIVSNEKGQATTKAAYLNITSENRPDPIILSPLADSKYIAGNIFSFSGNVANSEYQDLPESAYTWWADFHHDEHSHPALSFYQGKEGSFEIPKRGETSDNVWYRIYLNIKLASGLSKTTFTEIFPEKSNIKLKTHPADLLINLDGKYQLSPLDFNGVVGILRDIEIVDNQLIDTMYYVFDGWHDGTADTKITLDTPGNDTLLIANYSVYNIRDINGLLGKYYSDQYNSFLGEPDLVKVDTTLIFDWSYWSPAPGIISENQFSVRWSAVIRFPRNRQVPVYAAC